ncbi:hypothetical protein LAWI1_G007186 [Lachnellula willkommii]|uniref:BTB domain-containing protein n=1 Tax=Lachnellula willkommii TaxID=215461 RepID=A0A559M7R2_9HELO|nr:hypothetical protein LAWI1_G007186 [Lachnellula willkommii]
MSSSTSAIFSADDLGTDIVTIHVGPERKAFAIHKNLICNRSDFFSKAFNGPFKEGIDGTMHLPEDDAQAFSALVVWMYSGQLPPFPNAKFAEDITGSSDYIFSLMPLFHLSEKLCLNAVTNILMDTIQDLHLKHSREFSSVALKDIYAMTHQGSKLRTYAVLMIIRKSVHGYRTKPAEDIALEDFFLLLQKEPDFARDFIQLQIRYGHRFQLANGSADAQFRNSTKGFGRCFFHTHAKSEVCHLGPEPEETKGA